MRMFVNVFKRSVAVECQNKSSAQMISTVRSHKDKEKERDYVN